MELENVTLYKYYFSMLPQLALYQMFVDMLYSILGLRDIMDR